MEIVMCGFRNKQSEEKVTYVVGQYNRKDKWHWRGEFEELEDAIKHKEENERLKPRCKFEIFERIKAETITKIKISSTIKPGY